MSFSHREELRGDRLVDILTNEDAGIRLIVSRFGAELVSLARRDQRGQWVGFLYRDGDSSAPTKGWANHATVMGYFLHRLKDGRSVYRDQPIDGGTHSFLRTKTWQLAAADTQRGSLTYGITQSDFTRLEYPLNVSLQLSYEFESEQVHVGFHFHNHEPQTVAHVEFG